MVCVVLLELLALFSNFTGPNDIQNKLDCSSSSKQLKLFKQTKRFVLAKGQFSRDIGHDLLIFEFLK